MEMCGSPPGKSTNRGEGGEFVLPQPMTAVSSVASGNVAVASNGKRKAEYQDEAEPHKFMKIKIFGKAKVMASTGDERVVAELALERAKRAYAEEMRRVDAKAHGIEILRLEGTVASLVNQLKLARKTAEAKLMNVTTKLAFVQGELELEKNLRLAQDAGALHEAPAGQFAPACVVEEQELSKNAMNDTFTSETATSTSSGFTVRSEDTVVYVRLDGENTTDKLMAGSDDE